MWVPSSVIYEFFKKTRRIGFYFLWFFFSKKRNISLKSFWSMFFVFCVFFFFPLESIGGNVWLNSVDSNNCPFQ